MTTVTPFLPSNIKPFSFNALLDAGNYQITVTWNVSAQRFYINVYGLDGSWVITVPLIASPPARPIASVKYDPFMNQVLVTMVDPSLWPVPLAPGGLVTKPGAMIDYTLEYFQPTAYNGIFRGMHINETTFSYPMATDPGSVLILGSVSRKLNMVQGVFAISSLIYRNGAFEIDP
jgi:hypothetical protein